MDPYQHIIGLTVIALALTATACDDVEYNKNGSQSGSSDTGNNGDGDTALCDSDDDCEAAFCSGAGNCVDDAFTCACDDECGAQRLCGDDDACFSTPAPYRYVLLEDTSPNLSGEMPGADIDAVCLFKGDTGEEICATQVEFAEVDCEGNTACDPEDAIGAPDIIDKESGVCFGGGDPTPEGFVALNGGRIIVGFGDAIIENGNYVHIYEIGRNECGRFDDDPWQISLLRRPDVNDPGTLRIGDYNISGSNLIGPLDLDEPPQSNRPCQ